MHCAQGRRKELALSEGKKPNYMLTHWRALKILGRSQLFIRLTLCVMISGVVAEGIFDLLIQYLQLKVGFNIQDQVSLQGTDALAECIIDHLCNNLTLHPWIIRSIPLDHARHNHLVNFSRPNLHPGLWLRGRERSKNRNSTCCWQFSRLSEWKSWAAETVAFPARMWTAFLEE